MICWLRDFCEDLCDFYGSISIPRSHRSSFAPTYSCHWDLRSWLSSRVILQLR